MIILFLSAAFPAFAGSEMKLINYGVEIDLPHGVQYADGKYYIAFADLPLIHLKYRARDDFGDNYYSVSAPAILLDEIRIYNDSYFINDNLILFPNAIWTIEEVDFVAIDIISLLSDGCQIDEERGVVNLWIPKEYTINGTISLPDGEVAPFGGIEVQFYAYRSIPYIVIPDNPDVSYVGMTGVDKPVPPQIYSSSPSPFGLFEMEPVGSVIIPEGENSIKYSVEVGSQFFSVGHFVAYIVRNERYMSSDLKPYEFTYRKSNKWDIELSYKNESIFSGLITIDDPAEEDCFFKIAVLKNGEYTDGQTGVISQGEKSAPFTLVLKTGVEYEIQVIFDNGKYMRTNLHITANEDINDYVIKIPAANKITANLVLPSDFENNEGVALTVTMQGVNEPYYYLCKKDIYIPAGERCVTVDLYSDMDLDAIVFYECIGDYDRLYFGGHYNSNGTVSKVRYAEIVRSGEIVIPILGVKTVTVNLSLPNNLTANSTMQCYAHVYDECYTNPITIDYKSVIQKVPSLSGRIEKGENRGNILLKLPDESGLVSYKLEVSYSPSLSFGENRFFKSACYKNNGSTALRERGDAISAQRDAVDIQFLMQNSVEGKIEIAGIYDSYVITAHTVDGNIVSSHSFYFDEDSFLLYVPDEDEAYIFSICYMFAPKKHLYYSENGTTDNIASATPVYCRQGASGIDFDMTHFIPPYPMVSEVSNNNKIIIRKILRTQDAEYNILVCFYDEKNQLQRIEQEKVYLVEGDYATIDLNTDKYKQSAQDAHAIKVFIWDEQVRPLMLPIVIMPKGRFF